MEHFYVSLLFMISDLRRRDESLIIVASTLQYVGWEGLAGSIADIDLRVRH